MGNVTLPTPVALAGGAICILGGYLLGVVAGPDAPSRATGVVESYDDRRDRLCLSGEEVGGQPGVGPDGQLCGTWRRSVGAATRPEPGDEFTFVSVLVTPEDGAEGDEPFTIIYGDVAP